MKRKILSYQLGFLLLFFFLLPCTVHSTLHQSLLEFESNDQSMWGTGAAYQLNWRQDIPIYSWDYSFESQRTLEIPSIIPKVNPLPQFTAYGQTEGNFGLSPYVNIDSGSVDATYNLNVSIETPDPYTVKPGEKFTISTDYSSLGTGSFETNFPEIKAGVDILFDTHASAGVKQYNGYRTLKGWGASKWYKDPSKTYEFIGLTVDPDENIRVNALGIPIGPFSPDLVYDDQGRIPGLQFHNDTISILGLTDIDLIEEWSLGGYASISLNVPDINTAGNEATGFKSEGEDDLFRFSIDMDKIALDIVDKLIQAAIAAGTAGAGSGALALDFPDLEGSTDLEPLLGETLASLIPLDFSYNILDIESFFDIDVRQEFVLTPDDLMVSFDLGNGTILDPIAVGSSLELTMGDSPFEITPIFSLPENKFKNLTELLIDLGLELTLLDFGLDFSGIFGLIPGIDPDPLFQEDLTLNEILTAMNIPTAWMNPNIFNKEFGFNFSPIELAAMQIIPDTENSSSPVPEPRTLLLFGMGLLVISGMSRKKKFSS